MVPFCFVLLAIVTSAKSLEDVVVLNRWGFDITAWGKVSEDLSFAIGSDFEVYVSRDGLLTFTPFPTIPPADLPHEIAINPSNPHCIVFLGYNTIWRSQDGGDSFTRFENVTAKIGWTFHPSHDLWALSLDAYLGLYITKDLGERWERIADNVLQYDWSYQGGNTIIYIITSNPYTSDHQFSISSDEGKTWEMPINNLNFKYFHVGLRSVTALSDNPQVLYASTDGMHFYDVDFPDPLIYGYVDGKQFVENKDGRIWTVVGDTEEPVGSLYVSNTEGYNYRKTMSNLAKIVKKWDFQLIQSVPGTAIANVFTNEELDTIKTYITWDNGVTWNTLNMPQIDSLGEPINCPGCSLHLLNDLTVPVYSEYNSVGLIIGNGNIGIDALDNITEAMNTYISRDGGITWKELFKGPTIYEFGNFGGLLVLAPYTSPTDTIYYSLDGGENFKTVSLNETVYVINLDVTSTQNEKFILTVKDLVSSRNSYWGLDFSGVYSSDCKDSDYEIWSPYDGSNGPNCVMGHNVVYRRKKVDSNCLVDNVHNFVDSITNCSCNDNDFGCEIGFVMDIQNLCLIQHQIMNETIREQCNSSSVYSLSSEWKKLAGDSCIGAPPPAEIVYYDCSINENPSPPPNPQIPDPAPVPEEYTPSPLPPNPTPFFPSPLPPNPAPVPQTDSTPNPSTPTNIPLHSLTEEKIAVGVIIGTFLAILILGLVIAIKFKHKFPCTKPNLWTPLSAPEFDLEEEEDEEQDLVSDEEEGL